MSQGSTPEDDAAFAQMLTRDPANRRCFECGYDNAPWCVITHGLFVCLDCSGQFRGLGVHLAFVRSSTMDGWSNWKPEKLDVMRAGGNTKCRAFFDAHGVPSTGTTIRAKFSNKFALLYRDKLEALASGAPFSESTWQPPQWWTQEQQRVQQGAAALAPGQGAPRQQVMQGHGSGGVQPSASSGRAGGGGGGGDDFLDLIGNVATATSRAVAEYGAKASAEALRGGRALVESVELSSAGADITAGAQKTAVVVTEAASSAWGALSSWTTTGLSALSAIVSQTLDDKPASRANRGGGGGADDDGFAALGALTRNVRPSHEDYGHAEHRAEPVPAARATGAARDLADLTHRVQPSGGNRYEGFGSSPTAPSPVAVSSVAAAPVKKTFAPSGGLKSSPATATATATASTASGGALDAFAPGAAKKAGVPDEWGWDE